MLVPFVVGETLGGAISHATQGTSEVIWGLRFELAHAIISMTSGFYSPAIEIVTKCQLEIEVGNRWARNEEGKIFEDAGGAHEGRGVVLVFKPHKVAERPFKAKNFYVGILDEGDTNTQRQTNQTHNVNQFIADHWMLIVEAQTVGAYGRMPKWLDEEENDRRLA